MKLDDLKFIMSEQGNLYLAQHTEGNFIPKNRRLVTRAELLQILVWFAATECTRTGSKTFTIRDIGEEIVKIEVLGSLFEKVQKDFIEENVFD